MKLATRVEAVLTAWWVFGVPLRRGFRAEFFPERSRSSSAIS